MGDIPHKYGFLSYNTSIGMPLFNRGTLLAPKISLFSQVDHQVDDATGCVASLAQPKKRRELL